MQEYLDFIQNHPLLVGGFFAILALIVISEVKRVTQRFKDISSQELVTMINNSEPLLLDVRESKEVSQGKLKGAKHIPLGSIKKRLNELESAKNKPVVIYCRSGNRSANAAHTLTANGFEDVYNLKGGIVAWEGHNLPVSRK
ncbi:MAG: rhodanese-like domain-containing protein [bacterium]